MKVHFILGKKKTKKTDSQEPAVILLTHFRVWASAYIGMKFHIYVAVFGPLCYGVVYCDQIKTGGKRGDFLEETFMMEKKISFM